MESLPVGQSGSISTVPCVRTGLFLFKKGIVGFSLVFPRGNHEQETIRLPASLGSGTTLNQRFPLKAEPSYMEVGVHVSQNFYFSFLRKWPLTLNLHQIRLRSVSAPFWQWSWWDSILADVCVYNECVSSVIRSPPEKIHRTNMIPDAQYSTEPISGTGKLGTETK